MARTVQVLLLSAVVAVGSSSVAEAALKAQWKFDNDLLDSSGTGNNLAVGFGAPTFSTSVPAPYSTHAINFGGNSHVERTSPIDLDFSSAYSIAGWVNIDINTSGQRGIFGRTPAGASPSTSQIELYVQNATNRVVLAHNRSSGAPFDFVAFPAAADETWFHLAVTYDGAEARMYFDGVQQTPLEGWNGGVITSPVGALDDMTAPNTTGSYEVQVGWVRGPLGAARLPGLVDELFVFDQVLSPEQINNLRLFNSITAPVALAPEPAGLVLWGAALAGLGLLVWHRRRQTALLAALAACPARRR